MVCVLVCGWFKAAFMRCDGWVDVAWWLSGAMCLFTVAIAISWKDQNGRANLTAEEDTKRFFGGFVALAAGTRACFNTVRTICSWSW